MARIRSRSARAGPRPLLRASSRPLSHRQRCQPARGLPDRRRRQLRAGLLGRPGARLPRGADALLQRADVDRLRGRDLGRRAVLLPQRPDGLHRSRLLRRAALALRRARRRVRRGLRHRARVRPPRPAPARHRRARRRRSPGREVRLGAARAPGRLLCRRLGRPRRRDRLHRGPHGAGHRRRARRRGRGRRRPHPEARDRPRRQGELDPRLLRRAPEVVRQRLSLRGRRRGATPSRRTRSDDPRGRSVASGRARREPLDDISTDSYYPNP